MYAQAVLLKSLLLFSSVAYSTPTLHSRDDGYGQCAPLGKNNDAPWSHSGGGWGWGWKIFQREAAPEAYPASKQPALVRRDAVGDLDAFYQPPADFECKQPGAILRYRPITSAFFTGQNISTWEVLYRTTAINGSAIATVTTVFVPAKPITDRFLSFHTAYDSASKVCSPSYNYLANGTTNNGIVSEESPEIQIYLSKGYIVSAPDYEGPEGAFAVGRLEGMAVLDSFRAISSFQELKFSTPKPKIVGVGYSGGAIATGWAAQLQHGYAPDLKEQIVGWSGGGTPANLTGCLVYDDGTNNAGYLPIAIAGLGRPSAYGCYMQPIYDKIITPAGQTVLDDANTLCANDMLTKYANDSILGTNYQTLGRGILTEPTITAVLKENLMGQSKKERPRAPYFLYHGREDDIIPYANTSTLYTEWCKYGVDLNFTSFATGGHVSVAIQGLVRVLNFVDAAFNGTTGIKGCNALEA